MTANEITDKIIGAAIQVHRELGPGLLESAYESCVAFELAEAGLSLERQKALPVLYKGKRVDTGYKVDLLVEKQVVVEIKSVRPSTAFTRHNYFHIYGSPAAEWVSC